MLTEQPMQTLAAQRLLLVRPATPCNARQVRAGGTGGWKSQPCTTPFALSFRRDYVQNPTCKRIGVYRGGRLGDVSCELFRLFVRQCSVVLMG